EVVPSTANELHGGASSSSRAEEVLHGRRAGLAELGHGLQPDTHTHTRARTHADEELRRPGAAETRTRGTASRPVSGVSPPGAGRTRIYARQGLRAALRARRAAEMLPWKKNKFDLIEEDKQSKQKGYAVSLNYSALTSFARSCPESALNRVGSMFRSKRKKVKITNEDPTYTVLYLGNATTIQSKGEGCTDVAVGKIWKKSEMGRNGTRMRLTVSAQGIRMDPTYTVLYLGNATTIQSKGEGCTDVAVGKIWKKSEMGRNGTRMRLTVSAQGIRMVHADERARRPGHLYLLHRVTYCVADARLPKVFAWIYRHEMKHKAVMLRCHAVLVSKPEKAKAMALLLYQTSTTALAEFKRLKRRDDARHQQQQLVGEQTMIPLVPIRKLLNGQCCYKPPVERSRSAPKLGSITEDLLGEEEEERAMRFECEELLDGGAHGLSRIISDLGEMCIGNDVQTLKADLRVTRLLSGDSTSSESSIESNQESNAPASGCGEGKMQEIG
ncbi:protein FAM43A-like, partial [Scleropages formosus]